MNCHNCGKKIVNENNAVEVSGNYLGPVCAAKTGHFDEVTSLDQIQIDPKILHETIQELQKPYFAFIQELEDKYLDGKMFKGRKWEEHNLSDEDLKKVTNLSDQLDLAIDNKYKTEFYDAQDYWLPSTEFKVHPFLMKHFLKFDTPVTPPFGVSHDKKEFTEDKIILKDEKRVTKEAIKHFCNIFCDPASSEETWNMFQSLEPSLVAAHTVPKGYRACFSIGSKMPGTVPNRLIEIKIYDEYRLNAGGHETGEISLTTIYDGQFRTKNVFPIPMRTPASGSRLKNRRNEARTDKSPSDTTVTDDDKILYTIMHEWFTIENIHDMPKISKNVQFYEDEFDV